MPSLDYYKNEHEVAKEKVKMLKHALCTLARDMSVEELLLAAQAFVNAYNEEKYLLSRYNELLAEQFGGKDGSKRIP